MSDSRRMQSFSCKRVRADLAAYAADDLDAQLMVSFEAHLAACAGCAAALAELEASLVALRAEAEVEPPPHAMDRLLWHLSTLPAPAKRRRWAPIAGLSTIAAVVVVGVVLTIVTLNHQPLSTSMPASERKAAVTGSAPGGMTSAPPAAPSASGEMTAAAPSAGGATNSLGGQPSSGQSPASAGSAAGPAQRPAPLTQSSRPPRAVGPVPRPVPVVPPAPLPMPAAKGAVGGRSAGGGAAGSAAGVAAEKSAAPGPPFRAMDAARGAAGGMPGGAAGPAGPPGAPAPLAATAGAGMAGPAAEEAAAPAARRAHVLGGPGPTAQELTSGLYTVSDKYWQIRVEVPRPVVAGQRADFGLLFEGRETLTSVRAVVIGPSGRALGKPVDIALIPASGQVQASVSFTIPKAGHAEVAVSVEADHPVLRTRIPISLDVEAPPAATAPDVKMALRDVPLRRALAVISRDTGVKILVDPNLADLTVDADFADPLPLEAALRLLAEQVGGTVERTPDGAYRVMEVR